MLLEEYWKIKIWKIELILNNIMNCITINIIEKEGRYLLVIFKCSITPYLIGNIMKDLNKEYIFDLGLYFKMLNMEIFLILNIK